MQYVSNGTNIVYIPVKLDTDLQFLSDSLANISERNVLYTQANWVNHIS